VHEFDVARPAATPQFVILFAVILNLIQDLVFSLLDLSFPNVFIGNPVF